MTLYERGDPKRDHTNLKNGRYRHAFSTPRNSRNNILKVHRTRPMYIVHKNIPSRELVLATMYDVLCRSIELLY